MEKLSGKHFPAAVLKEVNDNMAMEELQQVQELEKELAAQYAGRAGRMPSAASPLSSAPLPERSRTAAATPTWRRGS